MGLLDGGPASPSLRTAGRNAGLFPRQGQRPSLFNLASAVQLHEPGTPTFTRNVSIHSPREDPEDREWAAVIHIEGGIGPNGEMLTSPRGAVGPAQVRPRTAPEAARLAGLPWDARLYRTNPKYNEAIGRAYYREQRRVFRDPAMAAAAYNSGPRRLRRAIEAASRHGGSWEDYLPAETRDYVREFRERIGAEPPN